MNIKRALIKYSKVSQPVMFALTLAAIVLPNYFMFFTEHTSVWARLCQATLPVGVFWYLLTLTRKPGKAFWYLFLFVFFAAFQLVLLYLFGCAPIAVDMFLNLVTTNVNEANEMLSGLLLAVIPIVIYYLSCMMFAYRSARRDQKLSDRFIRLQRKLAAAFAVAGVVFLGTAFAMDENFDVEDDIYPINVTYNMVSAVRRTILTSRYEKTSASFTWEARSENPDTLREIYVLVIGETARADRFGIYGYKRNTTPRLAKEEGLTVFRNVTSQSNITHKSVPTLLSAITPAKFNDIYRQKGIISAYKESGYATFFLSNQLPNHSFIDFFGEEADSVVFIKNEYPMGTNVQDGELITRALKTIKESSHRKLFLVLHTYGSHFNYMERYDRDCEVFKPAEYMKSSVENKEMLNNAYDNSIVYLDRCLSRLATGLREENAMSAFLYVSDHGEDIYDDERELFMHASPLPTFYQLRVPFLIWTSDSYAQMFPTKVKALKENASKHVSTNTVTFHTMLNLSGITTPMLDKTNAVTDESYEAKPYIFLNDHNKPEKIEELGLDEEDLKLFREVLP